MHSLHKNLAWVILGMALAMPNAGYAISVTLGGPLPGNRQATLESAVSGVGYTGSGNATAAIVSGYFGDTYTERGESTTAGNVEDFEVSLLSGDWDEGLASGTWTITDPNFWTTYASGAISMHVGNGVGDPDHFVWQIEPGELSGSWSYSRGTTTGGGLSNLKLFSKGTATTVSDGGVTLLLLGIALGMVERIRR